MLRATAFVMVLATGCVSGAAAPTTSTAPPATVETAPISTSPTCRRDELTTTMAYATIAGIDTNLTSLDIYQPTSAPCDAPVVVWVHGGGYALGDKANQIDSKVAMFNSAGWILVSVNYRLTLPGRRTSAQFPDHYNDVATAVAWVHQHIEEHGGDPTRIALVGHSAGADIVSNVVTNPVYLEHVGLALDAISCAAPLDTEGFDKAAAAATDPDGELAQWKNALGNNPDYIAETSATLLIKPGIGIPPMIGVVRGTRGRREIETAFLEALSDAGIPATTIDARALTHGEVNSRIGEVNDRVMTPPLMQFLTSCLN